MAMIQANTRESPTSVQVTTQCPAGLEVPCVNFVLGVETFHVSLAHRLTIKDLSEPLITVLGSFPFPAPLQLALSLYLLSNQNDLE